MDVLNLYKNDKIAKEHSNHKYFWLTLIKQEVKNKVKSMFQAINCGTSHHRADHVDVSSYKALASLVSWYSFILFRNIRVMAGISLIYPPISIHIMHYSVCVILYMHMKWIIMQAIWVRTILIFHSQDIWKTRHRIVQCDPNCVLNLKRVQHFIFVCWSINMGNLTCCFTDYSVLLLASPLQGLEC